MTPGSDIARLRAAPRPGDQGPSQLELEPWPPGGREEERWPGAGSARDRDRGRGVNEVWCGPSCSGLFCGLWKELAPPHHPAGPGHSAWFALFPRFPGLEMSQEMWIHQESPPGVAWPCPSLLGGVRRRAERRAGLQPGACRGRSVLRPRPAAEGQGPRGHSLCHLGQRLLGGMCGVTGMNWYRWEF